jgi:dihydrofolate reductase
MPQELFFDISMSLDGYIAGVDDSPEQGVGVDGERLHEWVFGLKSWREQHGLEGREESQVGERLRALREGAGASIMGHRMFEVGDPNWGEEPPFHQPVFILTHHAREPIPMQGGTTYHFITEGPERALELAREAAGGKDVHIAGGANCIQQYLNAGLVDHFTIHIAPILLRSGVRLFHDDAVGAKDLDIVYSDFDGRFFHTQYRFPTS